LIARDTLKFNSLRRVKFKRYVWFILARLHSARMNEIRILSARKIAGNFKIWLTSASIK